MNIILVVYDSLRKDCVGCYGAAPWWDVKTPHFDAFAQESLVMTRMYLESLPTLASVIQASTGGPGFTRQAVPAATLRWHRDQGARPAGNSPQPGRAGVDHATRLP